MQPIFKPLCFALATTLFAAPLLGSSDTVEPKADRALPTVTVSEVATREIVVRVPLSGDVVAKNEVLVYPLISGFGIHTLDAEIGDVVGRGEVLATLDDATLSAQLDQAQITLNQANSELDRATRLFQAGSMSKQSYEQIQTAQLSAQSQLDLVLNNHDSTLVKAPVAGIVSARSGHIGSISSAAGEPIFKIIADGKTEILASVSETSLAGITVGDAVELSLASGDDIIGHIRSTAPVVDPISRLADVWIEYDNENDARVGMFASGWVTTDRHDALAVPSTAVLEDRDGAFVQVVQDQTIETRRVTAGAIWQDYREVVDGLSEGERVLTRAGAFFSTGDKVNAVPSEASETSND